jgi:hypothetical protein
MFWDAIYASTNEQFFFLVCVKTVLKKGAGRDFLHVGRIFSSQGRATLSRARARSRASGRAGSGTRSISSGGSRSGSSVSVSRRRSGSAAAIPSVGTASGPGSRAASRRASSSSAIARVRSASSSSTSRAASRSISSASAPFVEAGSFVTSVVYADLPELVAQTLEKATLNTVPSVDIATIELIDGVSGIALVVKSHEGESSGLSIFVLWNVDIADFSVFGELASEALAIGSIGKVVDLEGGHPRDVWRRSSGHSSRLLVNSIRKYFSALKTTLVQWIISKSKSQKLRK